MSQFSGKCDFYDSVIAIHCDGDKSKAEEFFAKTKVYIYGKGDRRHKLDIKNTKDAVKYYPYLESIAAFNKEEGNTIILSSRPFIDSEESQFIGWHIKDAMKYWKKCKRKKLEYSVEDYLENYCWFSDNEMDKIIIERIIKDGNSAEFDDLHDNLHEYFRRRWFEEMVEEGYSEWEAFNWCFDEFFPNDEIVEKRLGRTIKRGE